VCGHDSVGQQIQKVKAAARRAPCATNPFLGAPRLQGELLKLGIEVSQATVAKYPVRHRKPHWVFADDAWLLCDKVFRCPPLPSQQGIPP
jgi:hypothetical protein